ncbi:MAG TPA: hypothetical protein VK636_13830, partial [Gemmatimonadaceae bacterium]|nr:hypothetical protein [Gemmatimonadaceae bacterium]
STSPTATDRANPSARRCRTAMSNGTWGVYHSTVKLTDVLGLLRASVPSDYKPTLTRSSLQLTMPMP